MPESTGTITVTNGSTAVTGSGTLFADNFVGANDALVVDGEIYIVKSVSSNTALTLLTPYTGTSGGGKSYVIIHLTGEDVINLLARKTTELVEKYGLIANSVTETPGAGGIPQADDNGKLADGWLPFAPSDTTPLQSSDTGSAGTSAQYARGDHVHPLNPKIPLLDDDGKISSDALRIVGALSDGAIIESGSNANGNWIRLSNGLQLCWKNGSPTASSSDIHTWTFPAAFVSNPAIVTMGQYHSGSIWMPCINGYSQSSHSSVTSTRLQYQVRDAISGASYSEVGRFFDFLAIGKWK